MTKPIVRKGLEVLADGQDVEALRRLIVMTVISRYLTPSSANEESTKDDSLSALLSRLPTKQLSAVASISKGKTGIKDACPGTFPLVVTAESRSSTDHFDFEGPGVMIPMVSSTGHGDASLKRIHYQDGQYAVGSILAVVQPKDSSVLSARYLHTYLSAFKDELLVSRMVGTANVSLTVAKLGDVPVPLLPIQGQQKIDELMALCDRMEAEQADAEAAHATLVQTLLGTLTQSRDAAELAANWQRLSQYFDILFTTEASLDALKQTILQLAVMGKLVPQDPSDEPASELLKRIADEKARLVADGTCKKSKPIPPLGEDEQPFLVPEGWLWVRLGQISDANTGHAFKSSEYQPSGTLVLRVTNINADGSLDLQDAKFIDPVKASTTYTGMQLKKGDVLLVMVGGSLGKIGIVDTACLPAVLNQNMWRMGLFGDMPRDYFVYGLRYINNRQIKVTNSTHGHLAQGDYLTKFFPLPPLAEQHRIVTKVDELMALCDSLKADLAESRARQARLATTLIETALQAA